MENDQQRRNSPRTTAGKDTRKKCADDTVVQGKLARTPTKGNRESIQSETITSEGSGRNLDIGAVMTILELAVKMVQSQTAELHNGKETIKCNNIRNTWSILSGYLFMCTSSSVDVLIDIIRSVRTSSVVYFQ